jgi:hypothetical protein
VGIAQRARVEDIAQVGHRGKGSGPEAGRHELGFFYSYAVLTGYRAAQFEAGQEYVAAGVEHAGDLLGIVLIVEQQRVNVAVTGVHEIGNAQLVAAADFADALDYFG